MMYDLGLLKEAVRRTEKVQLGSGLAAAPEPQSVQEESISSAEGDVSRVHGLHTGIPKRSDLISDPAGTVFDEQDAPSSTWSPVPRHIDRT